MKTFMAMLALVVGLSFGAATFVQADDKAAPAPAPSAPAGEMKKEEGKAKAEGKKAEKKEKKGK